MILRRSLAFWLLVVPVGLSAQVATVEPDTVAELPADPDDVRGAARSAQRDFERARLRHSPLGFASGSGSCDEYVGRFCTNYHEGEWYPEAEAEEIVRARGELVARLDSLQRLAPSDPWILGQRVWYRAEGGDWSGALEAARDCQVPEAWWCWALEGLAFHGLGRFAAARATFEIALEEMDPDVAREWRIPERAVDRGARGLLDDWEDEGGAELERGLAALWALADPLYLVDGNDRLTAHYARWTVSEIKRDARNPYGLSWSDDLEELTVRHGWELGYERSRRAVGLGREAVTGHKHPEGRDFMPSGDALRESAEIDAEDLVADRIRPRSLYAPPYAPVILPSETHVTAFPRPDGALVVATSYLPEDTTFHAGHDHPRPWLEAGDQAGMPDRIGLFALPVGAAEPVADTSAEGTAGALMLALPPGAYVLSAESWSPERRRAGRYRASVVITAATPDVAGLSDLLLFRPDTVPPTSVEGVLSRALVRLVITPGQRLAIAWEISGLGFRTESLEYAVSVERTDRNVIRRLGEFLGLAERPRALALAWQEPAPETPGPQFRHLDLDLPPLDPGDYEITLTLSTQGRSDVVVTRAFQVVEAQ